MRLTNEQTATIEHFRKRPGMLVAGKDGSNPGDDIYTVIRSALDYASAESGKEVDLKLEDGAVCMRVYGTGKESEDELSRVIFGPLHYGRMDTESYVTMRRKTYYTDYPIYFINILSETFKFTSFMNGRFTSVNCRKGLPAGIEEGFTSEKDGVVISFLLDKECFNGHYSFNVEHIKKSIRYSVARNDGLRVIFEGVTYQSNDGLLGLLMDEIKSEPLYEPVYLVGDGIEIAFTHIEDTTTEIVSFCNTRYTEYGGCHVAALEKVFPKYLMSLSKIKLPHKDVMKGLVCYFGIDIIDPMFGPHHQLATDVVSKYDSDFNHVDGPKISNVLENFLNNEELRN
jgi:topoisomerase-4 subunit B